MSPHSHSPGQHTEHQWIVIFVSFAPLSCMRLQKIMQISIEFLFPNSVSLHAKKLVYTMKQWQNLSSRKWWAWLSNMYSAYLEVFIYFFKKNAFNNFWYISMSLRPVKDFRGDICQPVTQVMDVFTTKHSTSAWIYSVRSTSLPLFIPFLDSSTCDKPFLKFSSLSHCSLVLVLSFGTRWDMVLPH